MTEAELALAAQLDQALQRILTLEARIRRLEAWLEACALRPHAEHQDIPSDPQHDGLRKE